MAKENTSNERLYRALEKKAESACARAREKSEAPALGGELFDAIADDEALDLSNKSIETLQEMRKVFSAWDPNPPPASGVESYNKREQLLVDCDDYKTALLVAVDKNITLKQRNRQEATNKLEVLKQKLQDVAHNTGYDQLTDSSKRKLDKIETVVNNNKLYPEQKLEKLHKLVGDNPTKETLKLDAKTENIGTKLERALKSLGSALQSCVDTFKSIFSRSRQENLHDFRDIMRDDYASYDANDDQNSDAKPDDAYDNSDGPSRSGPGGPGR